MTYRDRLHYWAVVRFLPDMQRITIARYHNRRDADGHLQAFQRLLPDANVAIVFDLNDGIKPEQRDRK